MQVDFMQESVRYRTQLLDYTYKVIIMTELRSWFFGNFLFFIHRVFRLIPSGLMED